MARNTASQLNERARSILSRNDMGGYTVPTASGLYPAQWNWDSCLVALGFAQYDLDRAWTEVETLFSGQWADGMVPHILFHADDSSYFPNSKVWQTGDPIPSSGITQPPVAAIAIRYLYERTAAPEALTRLRALAPKLLKLHRWLYTARDPEGSGLVSIIHPWESGMDNSPVWDEPLAAMPPAPSVAHLRRDLGFVADSARPTSAEYARYIALVTCYRELGYRPEAIWAHAPFLVQDIGFNAILMRGNEDLRFLLGEIGDEKGAAEVRQWHARARAALESRWCESDGIYYPYDVRAGRPIRKPSVASMLPLFADSTIAGRRPELTDRLERWLADTSYGVPSYDPQAPDFEPDRYWRGPIWLVVNWMLADGLERNGKAELADKVRGFSLALTERSGFAEYFNPLTGIGLGGDAFSWTAAMTLLVQSR